MLIVKVYINHRQIDEIHIQNINKVKDTSDTYKIRKPKGYEEFIIEHERWRGYKPLLEQVMTLITNYTPIKEEK